MTLIRLASVIGCLLFFYIALEAVKKRYTLNPKVTRKIAHIASGLVAIWLLYFLTFIEYIISTIFFILFFTVSRSLRLLTSIHLTERVTYGESFYPLGILLVVLLAYEDKFIAIAAIAVLIVPDTVAEYVGTRRGKEKKSFVGSLAFFLSAIAVLFLIAALWNWQFDLLIGVKLFLTALIATCAEAVSPYGLDNATVPLVVVLSLSYLL
jgi:phytol kinase